MSNLFECKVKYDKIDERSGKDKTVSEIYLFEAISFTEAEARVTKEIAEELGKSDFEINKLSRIKIEEIHNYPTGEAWYKCHLKYIDVDEKSGREKKTGYDFLVFADGTKEAQSRIEEKHKDVIIPWEVTMVKITPIVDIFPYFTKEKEATNPENI